MLWALLPLKDFTQAKQRLAGVLTPQERLYFFHRMVEDVLNVLADHPSIDQTVIVSDDPAAKLLAEHYQVAYWSEAGMGVKGLNGVASEAAERFSSMGAEAMLVVHGDLPLLTKADLQTLIDSHGDTKQRKLSIAQDRHGMGSNCVLVSPPQAISFSYGSNSLHKHLKTALQNDVESLVLDLPGAACDMDTPQDLELLLSQKNLRKQSIEYLKTSRIDLRLEAMAIGDDNVVCSKEVML
jgi:2-phospho-L-lactate guanylyltransferase